MSQVVKVGTAVHTGISVFNDDDTPKTGLINSDFSALLTLDGGVPISAPTVTVTEVNAGARPGEYDVTFTPGTAGYWRLRVAQATYAPRGFIEDFQVTADGLLTSAEVTAATPSAAAIRAEMDANSTKLAHLQADITSTPPDAAHYTAARGDKLDELDAAVSTRASASALSSDVAAIEAAIAGIPTSPAPTADENADALLDRATAIDGKTPRQALRYIAATCCEKSFGDPGGPVTFYGLDGATKRVKATMDSRGNRVTVQLDPP